MKQRQVSIAMPSKQHAIVLGGSLGGLMQARVLKNHFAKVTIIEKDKVERKAFTRKGQPQTRHLHGLLPAGFQVMSHYFPDLREDLVQNGALVADFAKDMIWYTHGGYRKRFEMNLDAVTLSRPTLEHLIRERVLGLPGIELIDQANVKGLIFQKEQGRVTGVQYQNTASETIDLSADLIIDVTGRGSRSTQWLNEMGFVAPTQTEVKVNVGYATRIYQRDPDSALGKSWMLHTPEAPFESRFGGMFPIEGNRWILTVGGWHGDFAGVDEASFNQFVKELPMPEFYDIISQSEPLSEVMPYKFSHSLRRHYERLKEFPLGYLVAGDAVCSFNPVYGQGMTSASLQAQVLDQVLRDGVAEGQLALTFFRKAAKIIDIPWQMAVGEDFRYPSTQGTKPFGINLINKYITRVHRITLKDEIVCDAFLRVMSLLNQPASLFRPHIFWRVMFG
jgi:2-polyprenyl-6-methoxyphenol hydroxylase-like FAD-dependent oxidoreductase